YDLSSPHRATSSERRHTPCQLPHTHSGCLIATADTLMQRLPPRHYVQGRAFELVKGQALAIEPFRERLIEAGYASVSQVVSPGECAGRGWLRDGFPVGAAGPRRLGVVDGE